MTKKQIDREYERINFELFKNKPGIDGPYPTEVVKRRELLLFAQVHLSKILGAKQNKDRIEEKTHSSLYKCVMNTYYNWYFSGI